MPETKRRTRGPRAADERARDAARTVATLFEELPPSDYAAKCLKPIAKLLRFDCSAEYVEDGAFDAPGRASEALFDTGLSSRGARVSSG